MRSGDYRTSFLQDMFFIVDISLNFRTGYMDEHNNLGRKVPSRRQRHPVTSIITRPPAHPPTPATLTSRPFHHPVPL